MWQHPTECPKPQIVSNLYMNVGTGYGNNDNWLTSRRVVCVAWILWTKPPEGPEEKGLNIVLEQIDRELPGLIGVMGFLLTLVYLLGFNIIKTESVVDSDSHSTVHTTLLCSGYRSPYRWRTQGTDDANKWANKQMDQVAATLESSPSLYLWLRSCVTEGLPQVFPVCYNLMLPATYVKYLPQSITFFVVSIKNVMKLLPHWGTIF